MAEVTVEIQFHIVRSLAVFNRPTDIIKSVKDNFGIDVSSQQVAYYDPSNKVSRDLRQELRDEFERTRKEFLANSENIPIANKVFRLNELQRIIDTHHKNPVMVMSALEQAAKEVGGLYTNKKDPSSSDGDQAQEPKSVVITVVDARKRADTQ